MKFKNNEEILAKNFGTLGIRPEIVTNIERKGFKQPTSIQNRAIPTILEGVDVLVSSATGSGKTLCYIAGIGKFTLPKYGIQALVLVPTKELAKQVETQMTEFLSETELKTFCLTSGKTTNAMLSKVPECEVLISTPGKLIDIYEKFELDLSKVNTLVLDEVDVMLDEHFIEDVKKIIQQIPRKRQNMFFSATISKEITQVAHIYMKHPVKITANFYLEPKKLKQVYYAVEPSQKLSLLRHLLETERMGLSIVFVNREQTAKLLEKNLRNLSIEVRAIYGDQAKGKRNKILREFREEGFDCLIATDLAARGLDVEHVTHIFNYNIPKEPDKYVHRIGRTARAGSTGEVINLIAPQEIGEVSQILKKHDISLQKKELPEFEVIKIVEPKTMEKRHKRFFNKTKKN